jgi:transposase
MTSSTETRSGLTIEWLPKYAPELNDIERSWRDLKRHFLAHRTFRPPSISKSPSTKQSANSTTKGSRKCATINESLLS